MYEYDFKNEAWYNKEVPKFTDITINDFRKFGIKPQIAFVVATEKEHKYALKEVDPLLIDGKRYRIQYKKQTYFIGNIGCHVAVILRATSMGALGPDGATTTTIDLIMTWNPDVIISVGIAMGYDKKKHKPGDVIISTSIINYDYAKVKNGKVINRSLIPNVSSVLLNRFQNEFNWSFKRPDSSICNKHFGILLTGGTLIDDLDYKTNLWSKFPDAAGAEMEGTGIWSAAESKDKDWIVIKSVCDWGDGNKNDEFQDLASATSISLCKSVFSSENALDGIIKRNYRVSKVGRINSFKLFFQRKDIKKYSIEKLTHLTKIPSSKLSTLEKIDTENGNLNIDIFPKCNVSDINKIERALECTRGFLSVNNSDDFHSSYLSYYFQKKYNDISLLNKYSKVKAIIFDFDGTLTEPDKKISTWQRIWLKLGYKLNDCAKYVVKYKQGEITHEEWCNITCEKFLLKNFSKDILAEIANEIQLIHGTIDTLNLFKENGVKLYITSGSIKELIEIVFGEYYSILFDDVQANSIEFDDKGIIKAIKGTKYDFEGKALFIQEIMKSNKLEPYEVLFLGNSDNDDWAYKSGARTLCVNPNNTNYSNAKRWHNLLMEMHNLNEVVPYVWNTK